jgi:hypothetical protein
MPKNLPVVYRMIQGECLAIFPTEPARLGTLACYAHIGQHCEVQDAYARSGKPASESEYRELHNELRRIYSPEYALTIKKRITNNAR